MFYLKVFLFYWPSPLTFTYVEEMFYKKIYATREIVRTKFVMYVEKRMSKIDYIIDYLILLVLPCRIILN